MEQEEGNVAIDVIAPQNVIEQVVVLVVLVGLVTAFMMEVEGELHALEEEAGTVAIDVTAQQDVIGQMIGLEEDHGLVVAFGVEVEGEHHALG